MTTTTLPTNRYAGPCTTCGTTVPAEGGVREHKDGRWTVRHTDGACPPTTEATPVVESDPVVEVGMYRRGEEIFKVQKARGEGGHLYAKQLVVIRGERLLDATEKVVKAEFAYAPGAIRDLTANMRMTLEEATALSIRYTFCCVCGRHLKAAKSVKDVIGPVCRKSFAR